LFPLPHPTTQRLPVSFSLGVSKILAAQDNTGPLPLPSLFFPPPWVPSIPHFFFIEHKFFFSHSVIDALAQPSSRLNIKNSNPQGSPFSLVSVPSSSSPPFLFFCFAIFLSGLFTFLYEGSRVIRSILYSFLTPTFPLVQFITSPPCRRLFFFFSLVFVMEFLAFFVPTLLSDLTPLQGDYGGGFLSLDDF